MILNELESKANDVYTYGEAMMGKLNDTINSLVTIYNIVGGSYAPQIKDLDNLIDRYSQIISLINQYYGQSSVDILNYVGATRDNLSQLSSGLQLGCNL